jgi:Domain of unknown function (DUF1707)/Domain of unknown function (DUF4190)
MVMDTRASDGDREAAVERLREAALAGRLESDELEDRLADAYGARWCSELVALTADITPPPDPLRFIRARRRVNTLAVVSLVAGLLWFGWIGSLAAIVTGHVALFQISRSAGTESGRSAALIGLMFGYFGLATLVFIISMLAI